MKPSSSITSRPGIRSLLRLTAFVFVMAFACQAFAASPDVVISQVYGGGGNTGATYKNDFIELHNNGASAVSLNGWSVQYASATGTSWAVTPLTNVTLQPGQYYLIQEAAGASTTAINLPTPDATGTIAMSGTAGKVALVTSTTALTCGATCATNAAVRDYVGFGTTANNFEGTGPTPAPSNTTAVLRAGNGCSDTDNNNVDFAAGAPTPRNSATALNACTVIVVNGACGGDNGLTLAAVAPTGLCGAGTASAITGSGHPWGWSCVGTGGGTTASCSAAIQSYTLNFASDANGTLSGTTPQSVDYGASASAVTASANGGYLFQNWTGTGGFATSTANPLTVANVTASQNITATFILASAPVNGACGSANGVSSLSVPTANFCSAGTASAVTGSGPWNWSCTGSNGGSSAGCTAPKALAISIFHVNDTHARLTPHKMAAPMHGTTNATFEDVGGAAHMAGKMLELTAANPDSLVIDAGDISEGSPIGDFSATNPITIPGFSISGCAPLSPGALSSNCGMTQFYQLLSQKLQNQRGRGMDAVVVGNHDVRDASYITNLENLQASGVPVISVNVRNMDGTPHFKPYTITTVAGKRVGILGYTTQAAEVGASLATTLQVVDCDWSAATNTLSPTTTTCHLKSYVDELRTNPKDALGNPVAPVDLVVLAAHIGHSGMVDPNPKVSPKLLVDDGVTKLPEVSVNGHWHTWAETPAWQPAELNYKTTITESGSYLTYIGELKIDAAGKFLSGYNHLLRTADITPDPQVQSFVNQLVTQFDAAAVAQNKPKAFEVVGYTNDNLLLDNEMRWWSPNEYPWAGNNPAGQWICDAMQWKAAQLFGSCDLAIETGGGVRADIPAGPVTYLQVYETFPWSDDTYVRINMTGQDILNFLKNTNMNAGFSRRLHVTSVDGVPTSILFDGAPLNMSQTYTVAINNYMFAHPPAGYTWPASSSPLTNGALVRDSLVEFMQANHATLAAAYSVGGPRYDVNTEFAGGFRAVVTMMNDNDTRPTFDNAFVRLLSANPETLARRGQGKVPTDLVTVDGSINPAHHLAEAEWFRSYLGFKTGALKNGDIVEIWGKGSFFDGNPEFVEQEGIYSQGAEFRILGNDPSLAKPAFKSSISEFWNDQNKNHYVQFLAKKTGASTVQDQNGQTVTISDRTAYTSFALPGAVNDILLITGIPTMKNFGLVFRGDTASVAPGGSLPAATSINSSVNPTPAGTDAASVTLTATASTSTGSYFLAPVADAQVASGNPATNYGVCVGTSKTCNNIYIQSSSTSFGNERGWLKFDLSSIPTGSIINSATLQLWNWKSAGASLPVEVRSAAVDTWTESGITWNSQPVPGAVLDTVTLAAGAINNWYSWNVTPFVQGEFAGDKTVSLMLKPVTEGSTDATAPSYAFDAREYGSNAPLLLVSTGTTAATITQVQYFYRYSANNTTWGTWSPAGTATFAPYTLSFAFPNGEGYYEFYSIATDSTGAVTAAPSAAQAATHYSATPAYFPMVSIDNLYQKYDGSAKAVTAITIPTAAAASATVTYNGSSTAPTAPGVYTVVANATSGSNTGTVNGFLVIGKGTPTIATVPTASAITHGQSLASSVLTGGAASVAGTFAFTSPATVPAVGTANQSVTFTPSDTTLYSTVSGTVSVTVTPAAPAVSNWPTASAITYGQSLAASTLTGGVASVPGTFTFTTSAAVPGVGTATQGVTFTPTDAVNFSTVSTTVTVTVYQAGQSIAFPVITATQLGSGPVTLVATADSGLPVSYTSLTVGVCTVSGATLNLLATGTCTIVADQIGDVSYTAAPPVAQSFTITAATTAAPVPALGPWGILIAVAGLGGIMFRKRTAC
ncbi:MAG TPA: DNRLRE domain-containing protein [Desulfuromonadales bacterium]|nr:DNRLRE domain-containing protein [Desulfuromonadales bacterium]